MVAKVDDGAGAPGASLPDPPDGLSYRIDHLLGPAVPPILAEAVASPIVVLEALVSAMTSSSQSLIIPGIVVLAGLPGGRRRRNANLALIRRSRSG